MTQIRGKGPVFMAIFILCLLVAMPSLFAGIKEKTTLNQVVIEKIPENVLVDHASKDLSVTDKMELIAKGRDGDSGVAIVSGGISDIENDNVLGERACQELEKLMNKHAILPFDTSDCQLISGIPMNYVDLNDMSQSVTIMLLHLEFPSMSVDILMDMETSQIYEYNLYWDSYSVTDDIDLVEMDEMIENFREYIGLSQEEFGFFYNCSEVPVFIGLNPL